MIECEDRVLAGHDPGPVFLELTAPIFGCLISLFLFGCWGCNSSSPPALPPDPQLEAIVQSGKHPAEVRHLVKKQMRERLNPDSPDPLEKTKPKRR
jgi:hypothetical protein